MTYMRLICVLVAIGLACIHPGNLSAKSRGVTGDLQTAIDAARSGDTLRLSAGTFEAKPTKFIDTLCGNCQEHKTPHQASYGFRVHDKSLWIVGAGTGETILVTKAGYGVFFDNCSEAGITHLAISGGVRDTSGLATDAGIVARHCRLTVEDCWIRDNTQYPESLIVGIGGVMGREGAELQILNNRITNNTWDGVALYRGAQATIADNEIVKGRGAGVGITWDATATVLRNRVSGFWKGIGSFGATRVVCRNNVVFNLVGWGIIATGTSYMDCTNNIIYQNGNCGFGLWGPEVHGRLANNVIVRNGWRDQWVCPKVGVWNYGNPIYFPMSNNVMWDNVEADWRDMPDYTDENGNVHADPLWDTLTFSPLPGSPLIDNGSTELTDPDGTRSDIGIYGGPQAFRSPIEIRRDAPVDTRSKKKK
ncbi:MAG: right-handed parallel beta-helix repeat-containing protein [candidate division Zixibacteria bacterium]|nr:right-handed parallel beta-helix repeat-containing protein [candidate division Zixibacteria bacterium]